jgi:hypothetical protein
MQAFVRRLITVGRRTPASDSPKLPDVAARCVRVAVLIGVLAFRDRLSGVCAGQ